jgi:hypothetical protein
MTKYYIAIILSFAFVIWGLYGFFVYALPLLFDFSWQPSPRPMNPEVLIMRLLAWLGGMLFFAIWGAGLVFDMANEDK